MLSPRTTTASRQVGEGFVARQFALAKEAGRLERFGVADAGAGPWRVRSRAEEEEAGPVLRAAEPSAPAREQHSATA